MKEYDVYEIGDSSWGSDFCIWVAVEEGTTIKPNDNCRFNDTSSYIKKLKSEDFPGVVSDDAGIDFIVERKGNTCP